MPDVVCDPEVWTRMQTTKQRKLSATSNIGWKNVELSCLTCVVLGLAVTAAVWDPVMLGICNHQAKHTQNTHRSANECKPRQTDKDEHTLRMSSTEKAAPHRQIQDCMSFQMNTRVRWKECNVYLWSLRDAWARDRWCCCVALGLPSPGKRPQSGLHYRASYSIQKRRKQDSTKRSDAHTLNMHVWCMLKHTNSHIHPHLSQISIQKRRKQVDPT